MSPAPSASAPFASAPSDSAPADSAEATADLLRIDFEAALKKLAWSQLQGTWQLPTEMVRLAIGAGAQSVEIDIEPRHLALMARGARLDRATVAAFASLLDRRLEAAERHAAMVELEERDAFVLSAIACSSFRSLVLTIGGAGGLRVELGADGDLRVVQPSGPASDPLDLELVIEGLELDTERASKWLRRTGRFASVPISVGGLRIGRNFRHALIQKRCQIKPADARPGKAYEPGPPLPTLLAIPKRGSSPRLWLLRHGIIATHATVPGYPAFEAAIEMSPAIRSRDSATGHAAGTTSAALRERLNAYIESLVDASVLSMIAAAGKADTLAEPDRAHLAKLVLEAALKRRRLSEVSGVAVFPLLVPQGRRLVSIDVISRMIRVAEGGTCTLEAIPPEQSRKRFAISERGCLALSASERSLLGDLLRVVFSNPPSSPRQSLARGLLDRLGDHLLALRRTGGATVADTDLTPAELCFLDRLRAAATDGDLPTAEFRSGDARPYKTNDGILLLPRANPIVQACVRSVERDPAWLYPATAALLAGKELPGTDVRRRWFARLDGT